MRIVPKLARAGLFIDTHEETLKGKWILSKINPSVAAAPLARCFNSCCARESYGLCCSVRDTNYMKRASTVAAAVRLSNKAPFSSRVSRREDPRGSSVLKGSFCQSANFSPAYTRGEENPLGSRGERRLSTL